MTSKNSSRESQNLKDKIIRLKREIFDLDNLTERAYSLFEVVNPLMEETEI